MSKVSAIQLNSGPNIKVNLYDVKTYIEKISDTKTEIVILPENFALMPENDNDYIKFSENLDDGQIQNYISDLARRYKLWIVAGTIPVKSSDSERVWLVQLLMMILVEGYHSIIKFIFLMSRSQNQKNLTMSPNILPGEKIEVIDTPIGRAGIACCYDLRFPELFRLQQDKKIEVIICLHPSQNKLVRYIGRL